MVALLAKRGGLLVYVWDGPSAGRQNIGFHDHGISPFSEVVGCTRADAKVVLVVVGLVVKGSHEVVDLRDTESDSTAYVELKRLHPRSSQETVDEEAPPEFAGPVLQLRAPRPAAPGRREQSEHAVCR